MVKFFKNAGSQVLGKRTIMRELRINEISAVDVPAQEGARKAIMKRATAQDIPENRVAKKACLTTAVDGHSHLVSLDWGNGEMNSGETSYSDGHSHPWVRTEDGKIKIGEARGHTHEVAEVGKNAPEGEQGDHLMTTKTAEQVALEKAQADLAKSNSIVALSATHRKHFDGLSQADQDVFLAKSAEAREYDVSTALTKAAAEGAVIYKSLAGIEFTAKSDPTMVAMAKQLDAQAGELAKARADVADAAIAKQAAELSSLPGDEAARIALVKAVSAIPDATARAAAFAVLKAQNTSLAKAAVEIGANPADSVEKRGANEQLDNLAKAYAKEHKVSEAVAFDEVLRTSEGQELYAQTVS